MVMASAPNSSAARSQAWIWTVRFTTESQHIGPGAVPLGRSSGCPRLAGLRRTISRFGGLRMAPVPRLKGPQFAPWKADLSGGSWLRTSRNQPWRTSWAGQSGNGEQLAGVRGRSCSFGAGMMGPMRRRRSFARSASSTGSASRRPWPTKNCSDLWGGTTGK